MLVSNQDFPVRQTPEGLAHWHGRVIVEHKIAVGIKGKITQTGRRDAPAVTHCGFQRFGSHRVQPVRAEPQQTQNNGAVGGMALAGKGKATVQAGSKARQSRRAGDFSTPPRRSSKNRAAAVLRALTTSSSWAG